MQTEIDYKEEAKKLREFKCEAYFKPEAGQYQIMILKEPELIEKEFEGEKKQQLRLFIEVDRKDCYVWDISLGLTINSIYGQIILIAENRGKLKEELITLLVKRANNKNEYTVVEAVPLMKKDGEAVVES